jgi:hypothetical protein
MRIGLRLQASAGKGYNILWVLVAGGPDGANVDGVLIAGNPEAGRRGATSLRYPRFPNGLWSIRGNRCCDLHLSDVGEPARECLTATRNLALQAQIAVTS